ncbi:MAG: B12-binding domain-containing radical SAM protein [Candidatus Riflebacteria bacterium]|nr:B12-binding domain-containing radical SAM protein [Candidatus Riflebacteria bacterium]
MILNPSIVLLVPPGPSHYLTPPLGLGYLAGALKRLKIGEVKILDSKLLGFDIKQIIECLVSISPDFVGITVFSMEVECSRRLAKEIRLKLPNTCIIFGGPHITALGAESLSQFPEAHALMSGEGEKSFVQFVRGVVNKTSLEGIPGLITRETTFVPPEPIEDLDSIGFPDWELIAPHTYPPLPQGAFFEKWPIAPILTSRGCPFHCSYCAGHLTMGRKLRFRSLNSIFDEIDTLFSKFGVREFHIVDDSFSQEKSRVLEFCKYFRKLPETCSFTFPNGLRLDTLDREMLDVMKKSGLHSPTLGIESGSQRILDKMKKGLSLEIIKEKVLLMSDLDLKPNAFFIIGYPGETKKDIQKTIDFALSLPLNRVQFSNFLPLPGTEITKELQNSHNLERIPYEALHYACEAYTPKGFKPGEIKYFQRKANRKFYMRPSRIIELLKSVKSFRHFRLLLKRMLDYAIKF